MKDAKKIGALVVAGLPPPDKLKRKPSSGGDLADDDEDSMDKAGVMAMEDFEAAETPAEKFAAFKRAVRACGDYE